MTTITALPSAPNRSTDAPATYVTKADAMMAALPTFITETNTVAGEVNTNASTATTQASNASTSATNAATSATNASNSASAAAASAATAVAAPGTNATSTTSLSVGTGSKSLTIQTGKDLVVGMAVNIAYTTTPTTYMHGIITAYNTGTGALDVTVSKISGSGTYALWTVSLVGNAGTDGTDGINGVDYVNGTATLIAGISYYANSSGGSFTLTMPLSPSVGDVLVISDPFQQLADYPVTLARNGSNFVDPYGTGQAEDFELNEAGMQITFTYTASGWRAS